MTTRDLSRAAMRWLVLAGGVLLLAQLFRQLDPATILSLFEEIGWNLAIVIAIFGVHECVRALAVRRCLHDGAPPFWFLLKIRFIGEGLRALTYTGPLLSEPARAWLLTTAGVRGERAYGAATSELIVNSCVSAMVTAAALGILLLTASLNRPLTVIAHVLVWTSLGYVLVGAVALSRRVYLIGAIARSCARLPLIGRRLSTDPAQLRDMEDSIFYVLRDRPGILVNVLLLELLAQVLLVIDVYWTLRSMGLSDSLHMALNVEALTKVVNVVQFVGIAEGGYAVTFDWLGMAAAAGFTLSIVKRIRSLAVAALGIALFSTSSPAPAIKAARDHKAPVVL